MYHPIPDQWLIDYLPPIANVSIAMKALKHQNFPIDETVPFAPDATFFVQRSGNLSNEGKVNDITSKLLARGSTIVDVELDQAKELASSVDPCFIMKRKSWVPSRIDVLLPDQSTVDASMTTSIFARGVKKLTFSHTPVAHSDHDIELRPTGIGSKTQSFVKDSVLISGKARVRKAENSTKQWETRVC